jgi:hypothetical protein
VRFDDVGAIPQCSAGDPLEGAIVVIHQVKAERLVPMGNILVMDFEESAPGRIPIDRVGRTTVSSNAFGKVVLYFLTRNILNLVGPQVVPNEAIPRCGALICQTRSC